MRHYIFTRFNLAKQHADRDKNGQLVCTPEWYKHRHDIFQRVYLPSIEKQTNKNFKVLLAFNPNFPEHWENYDFPETVSVIHDWPVNHVQKDLDDGIPILTSRVDNDDGLEPTYVERMQEEAERLGPETILDSWGTVINNEEHKIRNYQSGECNSPFLAVYSQYLTCYSGQHTSLFMQFKKRYVIKEFLFKQVIHNRNLCNR